MVQKFVKYACMKIFKSRWPLKITFMVLLNYFLFFIFSSCLLNKPHIYYVILNNLFLFFYKWWKEKYIYFSDKKCYNRKPQKKITYYHLAHFLSLEMLLIKYFPSLQNKSRFGNICNQHHFVFLICTRKYSKYNISRNL